jgi:hypothetical protein
MLLKEQAKSHGWLIGLIQIEIGANGTMLHGG